jgi:hypothetical protein
MNDSEVSVGKLRRQTLLRDWMCWAWCSRVCRDATPLLARVVARVHALVLVHGASELDGSLG